MNEPAPAESFPPVIEAAPPVSRLRWAIHLTLVTAYLVAIGSIGFTRGPSKQPALSHSATGLLAVCAVELGSFAVVFALAWVASRATVDQLLLRWRHNVVPVLLGLAYSIGLRVLVAIATIAVLLFLVLIRVTTLDSMSDFAMKNRPGIENAVDVGALGHYSAYYWLSLTLVSFAVGGFREELWRTSFLAGMKNVWPRQFGSLGGQIVAVCIGAVIFGSAHIYMGAGAALLAGLLGVGLGLIMVLHRSIWPAVFAHGFFDATSMALVPIAMKLMQELPKH